MQIQARATPLLTHYSDVLDARCLFQNTIEGLSFPVIPAGDHLLKSYRDRLE